MPKCPKCGVNIDVHFQAAPPMQADTVKSAPADARDLASVLERIDDDKLAGKAAEFVATTRDRFEKYKGSTRMSEAQMKWLRGIADEQESGESF